EEVIRQPGRNHLVHAAAGGPFRGRRGGQEFPAQRLRRSRHGAEGPRKSGIRWKAADQRFGGEPVEGRRLTSTAGRAAAARAGAPPGPVQKPSLSRIDTSLELKLAVTASGKPSPLKSAIATE